MGFAGIPPAVGVAEVWTCTKVRACEVCMGMVVDCDDCDALLCALVDTFEKLFSVLLGEVCDVAVELDCAVCDCCV